MLKLLDRTRPAADRPRATRALEWIGALYRIDRETAALVGDERTYERTARAEPVLDAFFAWVDQAETEVLPESPIDGSWPRPGCVEGSGAGVRGRVRGWGSTRVGNGVRIHIPHRPADTRSRRPASARWGGR